MNLMNVTITHEIVEMKDMLRAKLFHIIHSIENERTLNIEEKVIETYELMQQMSLITCMDGPINCVKQALDILQNTDIDNPFHIEAPLCCGKRGRPKYDIPVSVLEYLVHNKFSVKYISELLMTSESTVKRRLREYDIKIGSTYSSIEQTQLEDLVRNITQEYPNAGYRTVIGVLSSKGYRVQERRVRDALKFCDPQGVLFRRMFLSACRIQRRAYNVRAPLALWHIDGNHKLIRWRFVIHGGIDGYSRLPVFLKVNTNNRAESVLSAFIEATQQYGLPERVRSDKGGENVLVAEYMINHKGRMAFIAGRSVHNQRIERLWREVWTGCNSLYYDLFYTMEDDGVLDITNEQHMLALHLVYKPRIQRHLVSFKEAISHRPLRTEGSKTPLQLWISGQMLDPRWEPNSEDQFQEFGVEYGDIIPDEESMPEAVHVPESEDNVDTEVLDLIKAIVDRRSDNNGIDIYQEVLSVLSEH